MSYFLRVRCAAVYCKKSGSDGRLRMFEFPKGSSEGQRQRYDIWADVAGNPDMKIRRPRADEFLTAAPEPASGQEPSPDIEEVPSDHSLLVDEESSYSVVYVSGYIAKRLLKDSTCNNCRACITTEVVENFHSNISLKEHFANKYLSYPTEELCKAVGAGAFLLENMMPEVAYLSDVWKRVASAIEEIVDFSWIGEKCVDHKVPIVNGIIHGICAISIPWWCRRMNHSLRERRNGRKKLRILQHK